MKKRILFVDDQPELLRGLRRSLFEMVSEWEMEFVGSGQAALDLLARASFDVILSDMQMPGMDGAQLLKEVAQRHPSVIRIILSGHSDKEMIMKSLGPAHQFLAKPLDGQKLKETLLGALAQHEVLENPNLKELVSDLRSLPSLPALYQKLMLELQSPDVTMTKLGEIISQDIGMTAKMMQLVNSAFFGLPVHVSDPIHAAKLLGPNILRGLVISAEVFSKFDRAESSSLSIEKFTEHSLAVGALAKEVASYEKQNKDLVDNALIGGMLHDIGKLILAQNLPEKYREILTVSRDKKMTSWEAEKLIVGTTHSEVGAYLLGLWGLPADIVIAVGYHHKPSLFSDVGFSPLTAIHVANALKYEGDDQKKNVLQATIDFEYLGNLGLTNHVDAWREICKETNMDEN